MLDSEVLTAAKALIADPFSWVTGQWCTSTTPTAPFCVPGDAYTDKFCAEGAIMAVLNIVQPTYSYGPRAWEADGWEIDYETVSRLPADDPRATQFFAVIKALETTLAEMFPSAREEWMTNQENRLPSLSPYLSEDRQRTLNSIRARAWVPMNVPEFNDGVATHADVMALFEKTALTLQEAGR